MDIRQSTKQDLSEILNLYKIAREFMNRMWSRGFPMCVQKMEK